MASYFDLPPQPAQQGDQYKGSSLLSPRISRILDDLDFDDGSSSSDEDEQDEEDKSIHTTPSSNKTISKSQSNTRRSRLGSVELVPEDFPPSPPAAAESGPQPTTASAARGGGSSSPGKKEKASKPRHANMERFKSLRSVLFLSKIEDNMSKMRSEEQTHNDAALDWKAQHDKRQGLNRPATPDKEKEKDKDGLTTRVATKIRRMTSHSTPTMEKIPESTAAATVTTHEITPTRRDSTATDTDDDTTNLRDPQSDDELTRWVSHADPPSGSDMSNAGSRAASPSLLPADIPQLVQHASRLSIPTLPAVQFHGAGSGDSDASTASDSEAGSDAVESEDEDADELVRWVSRRDGALAGPVRRGTPSPTLYSHDDTAVVDEDVPELGSWTTKARARPSQDSGVSERGRTAERSGSRDREKKDMKAKTRVKSGLCDDDVDELVRWVSRRDSKAGGEEVRGRGLVV